MGTIKDIFKIILVIQLLTCALAFYGHPDAETIDFGSPSQPSRDQLIIEAAIKRGMDGDAVAELLRTKQPVTRTTITPGGMTKETVYKLEPDGSISSKSLLSKKHSYVFNSDNIPDSIPIDNIRKSPTGTITRTFIDSDGSKVTQTIGVSKPKASTVLDEDDLSGDWFSKPFPSFPEEKPFAAPTSTSHRTITRTFTGPNGERRTVQTFSSNPEFSNPETSFTSAHQPSTITSRTSTRTYVKPNGERHVIQTTSNNPDSLAFNHKPRYPSIGNTNWPNVDFSSYEPAWDTADPEDSDDGWEVVADPEFETTTKKAFAWTPKTWDWPEFTTKPTTTSTTTTTTTAKPKFHAQPRKPLPNLDDFLRTQYGAGNNAAPTTTTVKTETKTPKYLTTTIPTPSSTQHKVINIDDLPVVEILHNGSPANESVLRNLPPSLTPGTQREQVLKVENIRPIDGDIEIFTPQKNIRTYSKTHIGPEKPALKDLDPQMQEVLRKAGISTDDITNIDGDTITKTRTEPDGHVITTTYKVNTVPLTPVANITPVQHHYASPAAPPAHTFNSYQPSLSHLAPLAPQLSPISEFLALLGLTKFDITSRNGHYSKTFIDDNGEILTATFVLSSPRGVQIHEKPRPKPYK